MFAHPSDQIRCHAFRIDHRFIRRHVEMQVLLMNAPKHTQVSPERRPRSLTGVTMDFAAAIAVIIPRPLVHPVADGRMARMAAPIALPLIGIEPRVAHGDVLRDQGGAGARVGMIAHPPALLPRVPRDEADNRWTIVGVGPVPFPFIGTPPGRIRGVAMGRTFFPRRCGTVRRPQRRCQSSHRSAQSR
jgi:hypothetical protein